MKRITFFLIYCLLQLCIITGCKSPAKPFDWLKGNWEMNRSAGGKRLEIWSSHTDGSLVGRGLLINEGDTSMLEQIQVLLRGEDYFYIATVPDQNNGQPIEFRLTKSEGNVFTFENPKHDFPQRIIYRLKPVAEQPENDAPKDSLLVRVEGLDGGGISYGFSRK